jgi:hypothetical protein
MQIVPAFGYSQYNVPHNLSEWTRVCASVLMNPKFVMQHLLQNNTYITIYMFLYILYSPLPLKTNNRKKFTEVI